MVHPEDTRHMMRPALAILALPAAGLLAACTPDEPCSPELYATKRAELLVRVEAFSTEDAAKRDAVIDGLYQVLDQREAAGPDGDLSATCKAIDDLMAVLSD